MHASAGQPTRRGARRVARPAAAPRVSRRLVRRLALAGALLGCAASGRMRAQELRLPAADVLRAPAAVEAFAPPPLDAPGLSLEEAVRLTLRYNADIWRARRDLAAAEGRVRESRGAFDYVLRVAPGAAYLQQELTPSLRAREIDKRNQLTAVFLTFDGINKAVRESLATLSPRPPLCPPQLEFGSVAATDRFLTDRRDPADLRLFGLDRDFSGERGLRLFNGIIRTSVGSFRLSDICRPAADTSQSDTFAELWRRLGQTAGGAGLGAVADGLNAFQTEFLRFNDNVSDAIATRAALSLARLGGLPRDEVRKQVFIEASLSKPLRNGMSLSGDLRLESEERNYKDKPLDPSFGGLEIRPRFPAFVSGTLNVPLGKGRGRVTAGAAERAAELSLRAQRDQLRQIAAEATFRAVLAYVNLATAQARVRLLEESGGRQTQLLKLTNDLIDVDELPRVDIGRAQARAATVAQTLEQSRLSLLAARASLLDVMGMAPMDLREGPMATDDLTALPLPPLPGLGTFLQLARVERADPRALRRLRDASGLLAQAARADLKRTIDLSVTGGLTTLYESPYARYLPDEANPVFSSGETLPAAGRPVRYYSGAGWARSLRGEWRPFVKAAITFDLPFRNNAAKGRAEQAAASYQRGAIEATNLERTIQENVTGAGAIAQKAADTIERRRATIGFQQQTLDGAVERFRIGEITLLDTLVTEQDLTDERLRLVSDLQVYFSALSRLKFEAGTLLRFDGTDTAGETIAFRPLVKLLD